MDEAWDPSAQPEFRVSLSNIVTLNAKGKRGWQDALAIKPGDLSVLPGTYMVGRDTVPGDCLLTTACIHTVESTTHHPTSQIFV